MSRRVSVPGADELFRRTVVATEHQSPALPPAATGDTGVGTSGGPAEPIAPRTPSGRVRHDQKMTVYVTADELLDLEHARLTLRRAGLVVDRGRLVREAVALALADLEHNGTDSEIAHRLSDA
ncbi:MAG TPA: hypothetical protein VER39_02870 [Nocardioidaceae bacterium]|nr:hypothetical protein [Nocardioidaceae bacterium]